MNYGPVQKGVVFLTFHDVKEEDYPWFESVIDWLVENHEILDPATLKKEFKARGGTKVVITFDDGFASSYRLVKEVLEPRGLKSLHFICTGFLSGGEEELGRETILSRLFPRRSDQELETLATEPMSFMTFEEVRELNDLGHSIGAHTCGHYNLATISQNSQLCWEIEHSKELLEEVIDSKVESFAFPFGNIDAISKNSIDIAADNYTHVFSNIRGVNSDLMNRVLYRQNVSPGNDLDAIKSIIEGRFDVLYRGSHRRLGLMQDR